MLNGPIDNHQPEHDPRTDSSLQRQVRSYYRELAPLLELELSRRGDDPLWHWVAEQSKGQTVLELGCGTGRVTRQLVGQASRIVGIDLSRSMLNRARADLPSGSAAPQLIQGDIRQIRLGYRFDWILAADDPLSHLLQTEDRNRALSLTAAHLHPNGRFLLDALCLSKQRKQSARSRQGDITERVVTVSGSRFRIREEWHCESESCSCTATYRYWLEEKFVRQVDFRGRFWLPDELEESFRSAGLQIQHRWGDFDRRQWDPDTSEKLIVVATRRE